MYIFSVIIATSFILLAKGDKSDALFKQELDDVLQNGHNDAKRTSEIVEVQPPPLDLQEIMVQPPMENQLCDYQGRLYNIGDTRKSSDGCNTCTCSPTGAWACTMKACITGKSCTYKGKTYHSRQSFVDGCKSKCYCSNGKLYCTELCPEYTVTCGRQMKMESIMLPVKGTQCLCKFTKCTAAFSNMGGCMHRGTLYKNGENFVDSTCSGRCRCKDGQVMCNSLCPPMRVQCAPGLKLVSQKVVASKQPLCHCTYPSCVKEDNQ